MVYFYPMKINLHNDARCVAIDLLIGVHLFYSNKCFWHLFIFSAHFLYDNRCARRRVAQIGHVMRQILLALVQIRQSTQYPHSVLQKYLHTDSVALFYNIIILLVFINISII